MELLPRICMLGLLAGFALFAYGGAGPLRASAPQPHHVDLLDAARADEVQAHGGRILGAPRQEA